MNNPEPSPELRELGDRRIALEGELKAVRERLIEVIRSDNTRKVRQVDIVRDSRYTREQVRRICNVKTKRSTKKSS